MIFSPFKKEKEDNEGLKDTVDESSSEQQFHESDVGRYLKCCTIDYCNDTTLPIIALECYTNVRHYHTCMLHVTTFIKFCPSMYTRT